MDRCKRGVALLGLLVFLTPLDPVRGQNPESRVHAILFYSRSCPHCHELITEHLIPLQNQYGDRLALLGLETSQSWANSLYWEAIRHFQIPEEDWVVPILIVENEVLVGGAVIPARLPGIIEEGLASGGIDLPAFPALMTFLQERDLLDPRFPDRRILRPSPPEGGPDPTPAEEVADSTPTGQEDRQRTTGDSTEVQEGVGEAGDSALAGAPAAEEVSDSLVAHRPRDALRDSLESGTPVEPVRDSLEREAVDPAIAETRPSERGPDPLQERLPPTRLESDSAGSLGTLDLEQAARELESMGMMDRFMVDPMGGSLAVLVLIGMILSLVLKGYPPRVHGSPWPEWVIPGLVVVGVVVASYLSFVEVADAEAVCGPVGDCNTVNQSEYASLFGLIPVGVLGLVGYGLILILWVIRRTADGPARPWATLGLWGAALLGTLFSAYLTFLEPFVIGATCLWCLTSALVMTLLLWAAAPLAAGVWGNSGPSEPAGRSR